MPDFDVAENWLILVAIAEGNRFQALVKVYPRLTREEYGSYAEFVRNCQGQRRKAWRRWTPGDKDTLRRLFKEHVPVPQIAVLGRSSNALRHRLRLMGLLSGQQNSRMQRSPS